MAEEQNSNAQINTPIGSFAFSGKRMAEFISVLLACGLIFIGTILFQHRAEAQKDNTDTRAVLKEMMEQTNRTLERMAKQNSDAIEKLAESQKEMVRAQREQNCLLATPQAEREKQFFSPDSMCKRISR